ncbi:MAG: dihydrolipoyl dehydrogenase [Andreesenia angusta]|nr:dihydrolipoyl dehydrogenase [Andreesenia angusta]
MSYDIIVIGGGPAGYVGAIKAAQLGAKVALVEKDSLGGTCLNRGCIPTKTYVKNAEVIEHIKDAKSRGVVLDSTNFTIDMKKVVNYKNRVVRKMTTGIGALLRSNDIEVFEGVGTITKDKKVKVSKEDGEEIIEGKKIILAGGSKVHKVNIPGADHEKVITSDEILDLKELPERLAIVGGGVIGCEIATIFNAYGTEVTIIQAGERIVDNMDSDISRELANIMKKKGVKILTESMLESIEEVENGMKLNIKDQDSIESDLVLMAIGRIPDLEGVGEIEFEMNRNAISVNDKMETSVEGIYAPGDINARLMLAHSASKMAEIAVINALGGSEEYDPTYNPSCVYTLPEVSTVGITEAEAKEKYSNIGIGKFPFGGNGRAVSSGEPEGFIKVLVNKDDDKILGVHMIGINVAEMINEAASLMANGVSANEIAETVHAHPTYSEALMEACAASYGECIHLPKQK